MNYWGKAAKYNPFIDYYILHTVNCEARCDLYVIFSVSLPVA
jgi:hypothetical protein